MGLKHEIVTINNYSYLFEDLKKTSKINIGENKFFIYTPISLGGHNFKISETGKISFGCQSPSITDIKTVVNQLKGYQADPEKWYVDDNCNKIIKVEDVFEQTDTFFIDKNGKTFKKPSNIKTKDIIDQTRYIIQKREGYYGNKLKWNWKGYSIGEDEKVILSKLEYVLEVYQMLNQLQNK